MPTRHQQLAGSLAVLLALSACNAPGEKPASGNITNEAEPLLNEFQEARLEGLNNIAAGIEQPRDPADIAPTAVEPYTKRNYPDTVRRFGKAIPAINADRKKAAEIAAGDQRCNGGSNAQIATRSPSVNRRYWVECSNLTRFRFDEASLAKGEPTGVQTVLDMARDGLITD